MRLNSTVSDEETREAARGDRAEIDALIKALYEVISFDEGGEPDWRRMQALFSRHARITRITPEGTDYLDLAGFQELAKETFDLGVYTRFFEIEVLRDERRFGGLAHVLSAYETRHSPAAVEPFARGVNSLQLIRERGEWKVLSLFWDEERDDNPLALKALFDRGETNGKANS
ncbi:MAG TPA: hypothetical protein VMI54_09365 [Polyangiaceae bacterium]|nr:hypothetical protein [Polyangiaceae bacterium]